MFLHSLLRVAARWLTGILLAAGLGSCSVVGHLTDLPPGWYQVRRLDGADSLRAALGKQQVYARLTADTLRLTPYDAQATTEPPAQRYALRSGRRASLLNRHFDLDVFTLPFKIRPPRAGVPVQLNSNFNAALYFGRRLDFFTLRTDRRAAPWRRDTFIKATGIGYGAFVGLGSTFISPDVTRGPAVPYEYEGLVFDTGLAVLYDARVFNLGLAVGVDYLAGSDRAVWIYQQQPWVGVLFGLDLN